MKTKVCFIKALLLAAAFAGAGALLAENAPPATNPAMQKTTTGKPATPGTQKTGKDEEAAKIEGIVLNRANGGFLGLKLDDHKFKLSFYDAKKKAIKVDVVRATARWPVKYSIYDERTVLNPNDDGMALTSPKYVRPPYAFKLYLTLIPEGEGKAVESYTIDFHD